MSAPTPSLDQLLADPGCLAGLPPDTLAKLLAQIAAAQSVVVARLMLCNGAIAITPAASVEGDEYLTAAEASKLLRRETRWVWRNAKRLPFVKRVNSRSILCSRRGIEKWLAKVR